MCAKNSLFVASNYMSVHQYIYPRKTTQKLKKSQILRAFSIDQFNDHRRSLTYQSIIIIIQYGVTIDSSLIIYFFSSFYVFFILKGLKYLNSVWYIVVLVLIILLDIHCSVFRFYLFFFYIICIDYSLLILNIFSCF